MEQSGEYHIAASREEVWAALNDPDVLGACIDGCQGITKTDDRNFDVAVKARIGPVSAMFQAQLELTDLNPPISYVINGNAKGGAAGFARGSANVSLTEEDDGSTTLLRYGVKANVGGKLAQLGGRLVDGAARKMADDFFETFSKHLGSPAPAAVAAAQAGSPVHGVGAEREYEQSGRGFVWLIAFAVLVIAVVLAY